MGVYVSASTSIQGVIVRSHHRAMHKLIAANTERRLIWTKQMDATARAATDLLAPIVRFHRDALQQIAMDMERRATWTERMPMDVSAVAQADIAATIVRSYRRAMLLQIVVGTEP